MFSRSSRRFGCFGSQPSACRVCALDTLKRVSLAAAMTTALIARRVPDPTAALAGELGVIAFKRGYAEWSKGGRDATEDEFAGCALTALDELRAASASLG
jgi:hypothetical protein